MRRVGTRRTALGATSISKWRPVPRCRSISTAPTIHTALTTRAGSARWHRRKTTCRSPSRRGRSASAMDIEGEIEIVPDAAEPDHATWRGDLAPGGVRLATPSADRIAGPDDVERLRRDAEAAARRFIARVERRAARRPPERSSDLDGLRYVVIDLETTGTSGRDEIVEIGCVRIDSDGRTSEWSHLVRPSRPVTPTAHAVHRIDPAELDSAPALDAVLPELEAWIGDRILVFHNAAFDVAFLQRALAARGRDGLDGLVVCTLRVARGFVGGRCGLGRVARRFGLDAPHLHRALADARLTAQLWLELLGILRAAGASRLLHVPGVRPAQAWSRGGAPDPVGERLAAACARREIVRVALRLPGERAAVERRLRIVRRTGARWMALDLDSVAPLVVDAAWVELLVHG